MRPGNLQGLGNWFGEQPKKATKVRHPDLYQYNPKHIVPSMQRGKPEVRELAEQIYSFDLFTPEFCKKLIQEAEFQGGWETSVDNESLSEQTWGRVKGLSGMGVARSLLESSRIENEKDTTLSLDIFPTTITQSLTNTIKESSQRYVAPIIDTLWKSFRVEKYDQPYLLKYEPHKVNKMNLHYDLETVALIVYLNTDYEGGGTYFPRWDFRLNPNKPGRAAMWPGGVSHEHIGLPITKGVRYLLCCAYF